MVHIMRTFTVLLQEFSIFERHSTKTNNVAFAHIVGSDQSDQSHRFALTELPRTYELRCEKTSFCICENKDADQLRGNREADQRLCFRYTDSIIPLLPKSVSSSL